MNIADKEQGMEFWYEYAIIQDFIDKSELPVHDPFTGEELCPRCTQPKQSAQKPARSHAK